MKFFKAKDSEGIIRAAQTEYGQEIHPHRPCWKISGPPILFEKFTSTLSNDCISETIPTSTSELEAFEIFFKEIEGFQKYLLEIKFINEE